MTLFTWLLGSVSFDSMSEEGWSGLLFLSLYLLLCTVFLLNLLIAVLSTTYSTLASQALSLYHKNIIDELPRWSYHKDYNFLTYRVPPLNLVSFFALPFLSRCSPKRRELLERVNYLPAYIIGLGIILATDLLSLPKACLHVIKRGCSRKQPRFMLYGVFVFPLVALLICFLDMAVAACKLWDSSGYESFLRRRKTATLDMSLSHPLIWRLKFILRRSYQYSHGEFPLSTLVAELREELPFTCNYRDFFQIALSQKNLLISSYKNHVPDPLSTTHRLNDKLTPCVTTPEFNAIKSLLSQNSYCDEQGDLYIYPGLLLAALV